MPATGRRGATPVTKLSTAGCGTAGVIEHPKSRAAGRPGPLERHARLANFKIDGSSLRPEHRAFLTETARWMAAHRGQSWTVEMQARASSHASDEHNQKLSDDRYMTTRAFLENALLTNGVDSSYVTISGEGVGKCFSQPGELADDRSVSLVVRPAGPARPPVVCALPPTLFSALTAFVRPVSMGLTGDRTATLAPPADAGAGVMTSLSFPQGWTGNLSVDSRRTLASSIQFPVEMEHGGTKHVMPATVLSTLLWKNLTVSDHAVTGGADIILPLGSRFILGSSQSSGRLTRIDENKVPTFPLATEIQTYATVVFGYSVDSRSRNVDQLDLCTLGSSRLEEWLANHGSAGSASNSKTAVIAVYDLVLCAPKDDYQPMARVAGLVPVGPANVVRTYPLLSVWSSRPLSKVTAVLDIARPAVSMMPGMFRHGAISSSLYADMNSPGKSMFGELHPVWKAALVAGAGLSLGGRSIVAAPLREQLKRTPLNALGFTFRALHPQCHAVEPYGGLAAVQAAQKSHRAPGLGRVDLELRAVPRSGGEAGAAGNLRQRAHRTCDGLFGRRGLHGAPVPSRLSAHPLALGSVGPRRAYAGLEGRQTLSRTWRSDGA